MLRRGAIERFLKRVLFPKLAGLNLKETDPVALAKGLTSELIRSGHLPNHKIPMHRVDFVATALSKYLYFLDETSKLYSSFQIKERSNIVTFVLEIAACEIEELLTNPVKEQGMIKAMTLLLSDRINVIPEGVVDSNQKISLTHISAQRTLYDLDDNYIVYKLLRAKYPYWYNPDKEQIKQIVQDLPNLFKVIFDKINTHVNRKFDTVAERIDTVFLLIDDVLEQLKDKPEEIISKMENKEEFTQLITESYNKRYNTLKKRLINLAIFSTLSVFLSNFVTFYIVEVPLAKLFYEKFNLVAAVVDFLIPAFVTFILVVIIPPPPKENLSRVVSTMLGFVYNNEGQEHFQVNVAKKNFTLFETIMTFIYIFTAIFVLGSIAFLFYWAKLPVTSIILDTFSIALTVFAAVVIRNQSKELDVNEEGGITDFILDVITLPIAKIGSYLAKKWREYNIISIFFNFVVEAPLAIVLDFIQGWSEYIKEKRSEFH